MTAQIYTIQRCPDRSKYYASIDPVSWSDEMECWVTANPELMLSVLKNRDFAAVDFTTSFKVISNSSGVDLNAAINLFAHVPLVWEDEKHVTSRRRAAILIQENIDESLVRFEAVLKTKLAACLGARKRFDIVSDVFAPAVSELMLVLSGIQIGDINEEFSLSQVVDGRLSINRRKVLSQRIQAVVDRYLDQYSSDEAYLRTAVSLVGADSILGTVSSSFVTEIQANEGKSVDRIDWMPGFRTTGVPYVDKIAQRQISLGGKTIEKGQRVRTYLDNFESNSEGHCRHYFGAGRHVCIGKAVSQRVWSVITDAFGKFDDRLRIGKVEYRKIDYLFNAPKNVEVEFVDG